MPDNKDIKKQEDADVKGSESKVTITKELVDLIEESTAKAIESSMKAKKELNFHGTKSAEVKSKQADKKVELNNYVKSLMIHRESDEFTSAQKTIRQAHEDRFKAIGGDTDATGGYLVPTVFETDIIATFDTYDEVVSQFNIQNFNRPGRVFNLNELSTRVQVYRGVGENYAGATASTPTWTEPQIAIDNYIGTTTIKEDFLEDTEVDIMTNLRQQFGEAFNQKLQDTMINSTITVSGVVSKGIFVAGNGATTFSAITATGYTAVTPADLEKLYFQAISQDHFQNANKNGVYVMHPLVMQALRSNIRAAGTENDYISLFDGNEPSILGRPIIYTNQAPLPATTTGTNPYVLYGRLDNVVQVRRKRGLTMKINDSGTTLDGRNLNYALGRELVLTMRIGAQLTETSSMVHLIT